MEGDEDDREGGEETACEEAEEKYDGGRTAEDAEQSRKSRMSSGDGQSSSEMGGLTDSACVCLTWGCA